MIRESLQPHARFRPRRRIRATGRMRGVGPYGVITGNVAQRMPELGVGILWGLS